ncbi:MAG: hypothetical protein AAGA29_05785 [Planctomycetota bacterium]
MRHPIETFFGKIRQWFGGPGLAESKLARAELAAHLVRYNAAQTPIVGGVDQPGLAPLRSGEKTRVFIDRDRTCHADQLETLNPETALRTTALILTSRPELLN